MPASYPSAIYSPRTKANKEGVVYDPDETTKIFAEDVVNDDNEIVAIETELGTNPKGTATDVAERLSDIEQAISDIPANPVKATGAEIDTGTDDAKFATSKAIKDSGLVSTAQSGEFTGLTAKDTPVDNDVFIIEDSAASYVKKKTLWEKIKATLKTYFDGLYLALSGGTLTGELNLGENAGVAYDPSLSADGKYSGEVIDGTAGAALSFGQLCYFDPTDSRWELADANSAKAADGDCRGVLGMCVLAAAGDGSATKMLLKGFIRADSAFPTLTINAQVYVGETAGDIVVTQPDTSGVVIRVIGSGFTGDVLYFNPSPDYFTRA